MTPFTDIWSLGVILYRVIYKKHPLYTVTATHLAKNMNDFVEGKYTIKFPLEGREKFQPIIEMVERMLVCSNNKAKRLTWGQILDKIMGMVKIPLGANIPPIITNFDSLLLFTDKTTILLSSVVYYYKQLDELMRVSNYDGRHVIRDICVYLITLNKEVASYARGVEY